MFLPRGLGVSLGSTVHFSVSNIRTFWRLLCCVFVCQESYIALGEQSSKSRDEIIEPVNSSKSDG